jgi:hypothetical protein
VNFFNTIAAFHHLIIIMSSDHRPSSSGGDVKYDIPVTSSDELAHSAHSALAYVAASNGHGLENLEPSLAALSAPAHQSPTSVSHDNGLMLAPPEASTSADIAVSSLAAQGLTATHTPTETPKAKRLNRACDACSKRKVKVCSAEGNSEE